MRGEPPSNTGYGLTFKNSKQKLAIENMPQKEVPNTVLFLLPNIQLPQRGVYRLPPVTIIGVVIPR